MYVMYIHKKVNITYAYIFQWNYVKRCDSIIKLKVLSSNVKYKQNIFWKRTMYAMQLNYIFIFSFPPYTYI